MITHARDLSTSQKTRYVLPRLWLVPVASKQLDSKIQVTEPTVFNDRFVQMGDPACLRIEVMVRAIEADNSYSQIAEDCGPLGAAHATVTLSQQTTQTSSDSVEPGHGTDDGFNTDTVGPGALKNPQSTTAVPPKLGTLPCLPFFFFFRWCS